MPHETRVARPFVRGARRLCRRAGHASRDPGYHEFQYWLAAAYAGLGEYANAGRHLRIAIQKSTSRGEHDLYAAKLALITAKGR